MSRPAKIQPEVGHWYDAKDVPECFVVIDVDKGDFVEIQYQDGELDKIDYENWAGLHVEEIPEPEDAAAPYELDHEDVLNLLNDIESNPESLEDHLKNLDLNDHYWE